MNHRRRQDLILDGVEESLKFLRLSYGRLLETLREDSSDTNDSKLSDAIVLDCWTIVDHAKRLRTLLENTPGLKKTSALQVFLNKTTGIPDFRHHIQHIEEKVKDLSSTGFPVWGSVSWARLLPDNKFMIGLYVPGRLAKCKGIPVTNPAGKEFHDDVDHIQISVGENTISISELIRDIEKFGIALKVAISEAEQSGERDENDLIRFEITQCQQDGI